MSSDATPEEASAAFTALLEETLDRFALDDRLAAALEGLSAAHTRHVSAVTAACNASLAALRAAGERQRRREGAALEGLAADCQRRWAGQSHRVAALAEARAAAGREIARLTAAQSRLQSLREKDRAALQRQAAAAVDAAVAEKNDADAQRRASEAAAQRLRRAVAQSQAAREAAMETMRRWAKTQLLEEGERWGAVCAKAVVDLDRGGAAVELALSQMRLVCIDQHYERTREKLRDEAPASSTTTTTTTTTTTGDAEDSRLTALIDAIQESRNAQKGVLAAFEKRIGEETVKRREAYKQFQHELEEESKKYTAEEATTSDPSCFSALGGDVDGSGKGVEGPWREPCLHRGRRASSLRSNGSNSVNFGNFIFGASGNNSTTNPPNNNHNDSNNNSTPTMATITTTTANTPTASANASEGKPTGDSPAPRPVNIDASP